MKQQSAKATMTEADRSEYVSDCHKVEIYTGAIQAEVQDTDGNIHIVETDVIVCSKCHKPCTPITKFEAFEKFKKQFDYE